VVDLIKHGGDQLTVTIISVSPTEAQRLEPTDEPMAELPSLDYTEKRSIPISIPEYHTMSADELPLADRDSEKFVVYHIHMAGRHLCSRRYSEFARLHSSLKQTFLDFRFPRLPGKWPFMLSEQQLDARRRGLELYLEQICAVRVIAESTVMQKFLAETDHDLHAQVQVKLMLPDRTVRAFQVPRSCSAGSLFEQLTERLPIDRSIFVDSFALFETLEPAFARRVGSDECVHALYVRNYSTAAASCLSVRKWRFDPAIELQLSNRDELAQQFLFWQAVDDVNVGLVRPGSRLYELKALQDTSKTALYLQLARQLDGYGEQAFPACLSDARKNGHVLAAFAFEALRLRTCAPDGTLQVSALDSIRDRPPYSCSSSSLFRSPSSVQDQVIEMSWDDVDQFQATKEGISFVWRNASTKKPRLINIATPYVRLFLEF
jgi:sorting nexin-27